MRACCTIVTTANARLANVNRAIRLEPDQVRFYVTRALVQLDRQQPDRAIEDCDQAIQIDRAVRCEPTRSGACMAFKERCRSSPCRSRDGARGSTPRTRPSRTSGRRWQAKAILSTKRPRSSRCRAATARRTAKIPKPPAELVKQGEDRLASNEFDKALADFNEAIKLDPNYAPAYIGRAQTWAKKHYRDREIADYTEAIRRDPANAAYRIARAESWSAQGMHETCDGRLRRGPENRAK